MIGHIFAKDLRRLWPYVLGLGALQLAAAILPLALSPNDHSVGGWMNFLNGGGIDLHWMLPRIDGLHVLAFFLIVMLVQLDPVPGDGQDWLVRPIRRLDILLAKLLFVAVLIQGPVLAADLARHLAEGSSLDASLIRSLIQFTSFGLPVLAIGAMTRSIGQAIGLTLLALAGGLVTAHLVLAFCALTGTIPAHGETWMAWAAQMLLIPMGAVAILDLQYFRRATQRARVVLAAAVFVAVAAQGLPFLTGGPA